MRPAAADLGKLARKPIAWALLGTILGLAGLISFYLSNGAVQYRIALLGYEQIAHPESEVELCQFLGQTPGERCDRARQEELGFAEEFIDETSRLYPLAEAAEDPLGVGGVAAGLMASLLGLVVVAGLAGAIVANEWSLGTVKPMLARDPRRVRFVLRKFVIVWLAGAAFLVVTWIVLAVTAPILQRVYEVPPSPASFGMGTFAVGQVLRAMLVLAGFAAVGTLAAVWLRSPLATFGATLAFIFASLMLAGWRATFQLSPAYWVGAWMRFRPEDLWADHLWIDRFPAANPDPTFHADPLVGLAGLVGLTAVALCLAGVRMSRADVGG